MNSCELVTLISAIACVLAENCTAEELTMLSATLTQLADTITTINVRNEQCESADRG